MVYLLVRFQIGEKMSAASALICYVTLVEHGTITSSAPPGTTEPAGAVLNRNSWDTTEYGIERRETFRIICSVIRKSPKAISDNYAKNAAALAALPRPLP